MIQESVKLIKSDSESFETANPIVVDLNDTFRHMTWRKLCRLRHGHARKQSSNRLMWVILVVFLFLAMTGVLATRRTSNIPVQVLVILVVVVISYIIVKVSMALRWFLFWIVAAVIAMAFYVDLDKIPARIPSGNNNYSNCRCLFGIYYFDCLCVLVVHLSENSFASAY